MTKSKDIDYYLQNIEISFEPFIDEQFIVIAIDYAQRTEMLYQNVQEYVYLFVEDLMNKSYLRINFASDSKLKLYYEIKSPFNPKFENYSKVPNMLLPHEDPGMIALGKTTNEFIEIITPIRRLKTDITFLITNKNPKAETLIFAYLILLIFRPLTVLFITLMAYIFGNWKFELRFLIVQKAMDYFHPSEGKLERIKKNLNFVKWVQLNGIFLCELIDKVFNGQNRIFYFYFFKFGVFLAMIGLYCAYVFFKIKYVLLLSVISLFLMRYLDELSFYFKFIPFIPKQQQISHMLSRVRRMSSISSSHLKDATLSPMKAQPEITNKKKFFYENQRWYIALGFVPTSMERPNFSDGTGTFAVIPEKIQPEKGWEWVDQKWNIHMDETTDEKGWSYAKNFESPFSRDKKKCYVRKRKWMREMVLCKKVE